MMEKNGLINQKKVDLGFIFTTMVSIVFVFLFVNRLFYGIETSDEAFYNVTGYRLLQGNVPYGDMWELNAPDAYVMLPFLLLHKMIYGSMDGVFLFLRLSYIFLQIIGLCCVYLYAKKEINGKYAFLLGIAFWLHAPFNLYNFSYNNMLELFFTASICMMLLRFDYEQKKYEYLTGVFMGLAVLVYPSFIFGCFAIAAIIPMVIRSKKSLKFLIMYVVGGLTVAIPVLCHIAVTYGLQNVIHNLSIIMSSGSTAYIGENHLIKNIYDGITYLGAPFIVGGKAFVLYFITILILGFINKIRHIGKYFLALYPIICCYCCVLSGRYYLFPLAVCVVAPLVIEYSDNRMEMLKKVAIEWGSSMLIYFVIAFSSSGGASNACRSTMFAAIVTIKLIIEVIQNDFLLKFKKLIPYIPLTLFLFGLLIIFYSGMYRDNPYKELTTKVESGVYKGIYTTPQRKQHITDLENIMSRIEKKGETVMILYHSCYAYLMVDMVPKTPSSWGCFDYEAYGYDNQDLFMHYLSDRGNIPENIIIIDIPEQFDYAGQQVEKYMPYYPMLNQFIKDHYIYQGEYEEGLSGQVVTYELDKGTLEN
ncbi:hypothetical protein [Anaerovibrio lipolyticus]|uniref:hypothetical protein n=1 Tax=Anaerovibrio lipolyticus TaxID=82374 RepID=UPI00047F20EC|nr:hypothetical protein [Anaerovibrio lipolyticus]